jgi:hypothetical protein
MADWDLDDVLSTACEVCVAAIVTVWGHRIVEELDMKNGREIVLVLALVVRHLLPIDALAFILEFPGKTLTFMDLLM